MQKRLENLKSRLVHQIIIDRVTLRNICIVGLLLCMLFPVVNRVKSFRQGLAIISSEFLIQYRNTFSLGHQLPYDFRDVDSSFGLVDLRRINEIERKEFKALIIESLPTGVQPKLVPYLDLSLEISEAYQLDPFWLISIMWIESQFNEVAKSNKSAHGLMQIMPNTGRFLAEKLNVKLNQEEVKDALLSPVVNIEMGAIYLKMLLDQFANDYQLATIAYNMGPVNVSKRVRSGEEFIDGNNYLMKVNAAYSVLTKKFRVHIGSTPALFKNTLVVSSPMVAKHNAFHQSLDRIFP